MLEDGRLRIEREGRWRKCVERVGQLCFNGEHASRQAIRATYITERAVFRLREGRLVDLQPACALAEPWWRLRTETIVDVAAQVRGEAVSFETAVLHAARILDAARTPLIYGLSRSSTPGQRAAVQLADRIGATIEELGKELEAMAAKAPQWEREHRAAIRALNAEVIRRAVGHLLEEIRARFAGNAAVLAWLLGYSYAKRFTLLAHAWLGAALGIPLMAGVAARLLLGYNAADLTLAQAALIAGVIRAPAAYSPWTHLDAARAREQASER
mgnify:CR=1 FL=1